MDEIEKSAMVREVAEKSKILLSEGDPIFALVEMNGILMKKYSETLEALTKNISASVQNSTSQNAAIMSAAAKEAAVKTVHTFQKIATEFSDKIARLHEDHLERFGEIGGNVRSESKADPFPIHLFLTAGCLVLQTLTIIFLLKM